MAHDSCAARIRARACAAVIIFVLGACVPYVEGRAQLDNLGVTQSNALPFNMPSTQSAKRVFAHYMPNFPISYDNLSSADDYYTKQLLAPSGEGGVHEKYGGYLRDRPLPRNPITSGDYRKSDLVTEINQARSSGIDGFSVDVILPAAQSDAVTRIQQAAETVSGGFTIMPVADMSGPLGQLEPQQFATEMTQYLRSPAVTRLDDGRPVLSAFLAENRDIQWWTIVLKILADSLKKSVAFVPIMLDANAHLEDFARISYGMSSWGPVRSPGATNPTISGRGSLVDLARRAHAAHCIWMSPVAFQDNRPYLGIYDESGNSTTLRNTWRVADVASAEWVQMLTWNDYAETTQFAPSLRSNRALLDLNSYFVATYKWGAPKIVRNVVYVDYRTQFYASRPSYELQTELMRLRPGSDMPTDLVEIIAFAKTTGVAGVSLDGKVSTCPAPGAEVTVCTFALEDGEVVAGIGKSDSWTTIARPAAKVTATPYVQDLQYVVASSSY